MSKERMTEKVTVRKSNKSVKSAVMLFGAVLITTSLLGGVLAKYTTEIGTASDEGRVAKWGLTEKEQTFNLFKTAYDSNPGTRENTVESKNTQKVIAPGTTSFVEIGPEFSDAELNSIETAFRVYYVPGEIEAVTNKQIFGKYVGDWQITPSDPSVEPFGWWPLQFKISGGYDGTDYQTEIYNGITGTPGDEGNTQLDNLNNAIGKLTATDERRTEIIYPNDTLQQKREKLRVMQLRIEWNWPFSRSDEIDKWDTQLGNKLMGSMDNNDSTTPRFEVEMAYRAVQED